MKVVRIRTSKMLHLTNIEFTTGNTIQIMDWAHAGHTGEQIAQTFETEYMEQMTKIGGFPDREYITEVVAKANDWETLYEVAIPNNVLQFKAK